MTRPLWFVNLLKKTFPNVKLIAKLTRVPLIGKVFDFLLFDGDNITYLTQDRIITINQEVIKSEEIVLPSQVINYFIEKARYHWIMNFCICRDSMQCKDYPINLGCLFLGEAVLGINPQLGRLVSKTEALEHIKKCKEAGLVHMIGRNRLDAQWLGVKPGNKLLSICNCDPCCCLWRISPIIAPKIGKKIHKMAGIIVKINDNCIGCGTCMKGICFVHAIQLRDKHAEISDECRGCGRCVEVCPQNAIELIVNNKEYVQNSIELIDKLIDVS